MNRDRDERPSMPGAGTAEWLADVDGMCGRMQTEGFESKALRVLDEPLRVDLSDHLRRNSGGEPRQES